MPYKANQARRHRIPRARYQVTNWPEYDGALQRRDSLTVWVTPETLAGIVTLTGGRARSTARQYRAVVHAAISAQHFGAGFLPPGPERLGADAAVRVGGDPLPPRAEVPVD